MKREDTHTDAHLLRLLANGDPLAFARVMDQHQDMVHSLALRILKSRELAEETVQEVFLKIWLNRADMNRIDNFGAYIYTLSKNYVNRQLQIMACDQRAKVALAYEARQGSEHEEEVTYHAILNDAINKLPQTQQQVFRMAKLQQMSYEEIAKAMGISSNTVKNHMIRALKRIRLTASGSGILMPVLLAILEV